MGYDRNYYKELAFALRLRGLNEAHIKGTLEDVQNHTRTSGSEPRADFGRPKDYAEQFEARKNSTPGRKFVTGAAIAALLVAIAQLVIGLAFQLDARIGPVPVFLGLAVLLIIVGLIGGFILDRRLPRGFKNQESA